MEITKSTPQDAYIYPIVRIEFILGYFLAVMRLLKKQEIIIRRSMDVSIAPIHVTQANE